MTAQAETWGPKQGITERISGWWQETRRRQFDKVNKSWRGIHEALVKDPECWSRRMAGEAKRDIAWYRLDMANGGTEGWEYLCSMGEERSVIENNPLAYMSVDALRGQMGRMDKALETLENNPYLNEFDLIDKEASLSFRSLGILIGKGTEADAEKAARILDKHKGLWEHLDSYGINGFKFYDKLLPYWVHRSNHPSEALSLEDSQMFIHRWLYGVDRGYVFRSSVLRKDGDMAVEGVYRMNEELKDRLSQLVLRFAGLTQEETEKVMGDWEKVLTDRYERWRLPGMYRENITNVLRLDVEDGSAVAELHRKFSISHFGRYDIRMLLDQFNQRNDKDIPYVFYLNSRTDHNGAYDGFANTYFQEYLRLERDGYAVRILETGNELSDLKKFSGLVREFGGKEKLKAVYVFGHAADDFGQSVSLDLKRGSETDRSGAFRKSFLENERLLRFLKKYIDPRTGVSMIVCSAGMKGGLGETAHKQLGVDVVTMKVPTAGFFLGHEEKEGGFLRLNYGNIPEEELAEF